jgi:hypothetical protein
MQDHDFYASFFIRLWRSSKGARADQDEKFRLEVEHIQSGKIQRIETPEELLEFITSFTGIPAKIE